MATTPDLSSRPHQCSVEKILSASPEQLFAAWTTSIDQWFAAPGTLIINPTVGGLFFFETHFEGGRHPHYGRFLQIQKNELIQLTWVTGNPGTMGAETVITIHLTPEEEGTNVSLTHAGFADAETMKGHEEAWIHVLDHLQQSIDDNRL